MEINEQMKTAPLHGDEPIIYRVKCDWSYSEHFPKSFESNGEKYPFVDIHGCLRVDDEHYLIESYMITTTAMKANEEEIRLYKAWKLMNR